MTCHLLLILPVQQEYYRYRQDGVFMDDLEKFRIRHQMRCKLVEDADQLFKYYIANAYTTQVPMICLQVNTNISISCVLSFHFYCFHYLKIN